MGICGAVPPGAKAFLLVTDNRRSRLESPFCVITQHRKVEFGHHHHRQSKKISNAQELTMQLSQTLSSATLCWQTPLATISHPEGRHGTAQMEHITTRLTTSWWRNGSVQVLKLPEPEHSQVQILEATMTWRWWLSRHALRIQGTQSSQESGLTERSWMIQQ